MSVSLLARQYQFCKNLWDTISCEHILRCSVDLIETYPSYNLCMSQFSLFVVGIKNAQGKHCSPQLVQKVLETLYWLKHVITLTTKRSCTTLYPCPLLKSNRGGERERECLVLLRCVALQKFYFANVSTVFAQRFLVMHHCSISPMFTADLWISTGRCLLVDHCFLKQ